MLTKTLFGQADQKAPDARPQAPTEPERTVIVREDSGGAENAADGLFHQPADKKTEPLRVRFSNAASPQWSSSIRRIEHPPHPPTRSRLERVPVSAGFGGRRSCYAVTRQRTRRRSTGFLGTVPISPRCRGAVVHPMAFLLSGGSFGSPIRTRQGRGKAPLLLLFPGQRPFTSTAGYSIFKDQLQLSMVL